jgi:dolichol-phosphate mannosyltransferase
MINTKLKKISLAVIIPMYNEEKVASKCVDLVMYALRKLSNPFVLIIVNDGSKDKTTEILKQKQIKYKKNFMVLTHVKNLGFGAGNITGIKKAQTLGFEWCLHMDAGLTNDPKYIEKFMEFADSKYDCIKASRYIKHSKVIGVPKYRRIISILGNSVASLLFGVGIRDCTNGFRMVRLSKLKSINFKENNYSIILEELYYLKKQGAAFKEIPYTLVMDRKTVSHFNYKPKTFYDYFKYAFKSFFA